MLSRRRFLASTALAGLAALFPGIASAFSVEDADAEAARLYATACGSQDAETHRRLLAELEPELAGKTEEERRLVLAAVSCPVCGCGLVDALP